MSMRMRDFLDLKSHWLLGIAARDAISGFERELGRFAGVSVHAEGDGQVACLICEASPRLVWPAEFGFSANSREVVQILGALSAMVPFLPARIGTRINGREAAAKLASDRELELRALIDAYGDYLQVDVAGCFDEVAASAEIARFGPLSDMLPETSFETQLMERSHAQTLAGRRAEFEARLRRTTSRLAEEYVELLPPTQGTHRRLLIRRQRRAELRETLAELSDDGRYGATISIGLFMPPVNFHRLMIESADIQAIDEARRTLRLEPVTRRQAIQVAYRRALERAYPGRRDRKLADHRLTRLAEQFRLLDLVAEGQIRAARGGSDMEVHLFGDDLAGTFVLSFDVDHPGLKVA